jgi:hypothetical protein
MAPQPVPFRIAVLHHGRRLAELLGGGMQMIEMYFAHKLAIHHYYRPRLDDIFVVSFPKSGTTLMQMMLYQMTTSGEMDFPHIDSVSPWFESFLYSGLDQFIEQVPSPRILKSHLFYEHLPRNARCIYIARDLRDVIVSASHRFRLAQGWTGDDDFKAFADRMLAGTTLFGSWFKHIESWWPHRNDRNVLFLRYEEVIADLPGTMNRVAAFCGLTVDEATAARVLERCSVPFMKRYNEKFDPRLRQLASGSMEFVRKGAAGEGRNRLTPAQEETAAKRLNALARKLGCDPGDPHHDLLLWNECS